MKTLLSMASAFAASILMFLYVKVTLPFFMFLDRADKWLMEVLNFDGGTVLDGFFYGVSSRLAWIPIGVAFVSYLLYSKRYRRQTLLIIIALALAVTIADQVSSSIIKPAVERLRPSHCAEIESSLHFVNNYRSGRFGFCSSHAANAVGVFMFVSLLLRKKWVTYALLAWTLLVCYSRIYLGVHYPGDIICGGFVGVVSGVLVFRLYKYAVAKIYDKYSSTTVAQPQSPETRASVNP